MFLYANNAEARINYARITADHMVRAVEQLPNDQTVFWVTLVRREYAVREDEAHAFNINRLKRWIHQLLQGCNYVGMVEAALFTNLDVVGAAFKRTVSWHVHCQLWGVSEEQIAQICDDANDRYRTIVPGIEAAHYRPLKDSEVAGQAYYMSKGQISEYRVWARKERMADCATGEIAVQTTGRFISKKRDLRPCDLARMCMVFAGRTLDQLRSPVVMAVWSFRPSVMKHSASFDASKAETLLGDLHRSG